jgi:hypothetical protein
MDGFDIPALTRSVYTRGSIQQHNSGTQSRTERGPESVVDSRGTVYTTEVSDEIDNSIIQ